MKKRMNRWILAGLVLFSGAASAVDCDAYRARFNCPADEKFPLHLSFDDGPALQTPDVLRALQRERVPATFFVLAEKIDCDTIGQQCRTEQPGVRVQDCEAFQQCQLRRQILARTRQAGFTIGSHSYSHLHYSMIPQDKMRQHFQRSKALLQPFLNTHPPLFRLPYGDGWFNRTEKQHVLQAVEHAGFQHVAWQMSAFDWDEKNQQGDKILANVMSQVCSRKRGGVVLFHDGMPEEMHQGRVFTTRHLAEWIPALRCVVDFKPLSFFEKGFAPKP